MRKFFTITLCSIVGIFAASSAIGQIITATPNDNFVTSGTGRDIALNGTSDTFTLDLSSDDAADLGLFAIVGNVTAAESDTGYYAGLDGAVGLTTPNLVVGRNANGNTGTFVWKFVLDSGFTTTGGTITADVGFNGTPSTQKANAFIGGNDVFTPSAGPSFSSYNSGDFSKVNLTSNSATFGTYSEELMLAVPTGVSEFYVVLSDVGTSARFGLSSLSVDVTAIPEPSALGLMAGAGIAFLARRRRTTPRS